MLPAYCRVLSAIALALVSTASIATATIYTSSSAFLAHVGSGAYTENFDGLANPPPASFSGGGYAYTVSAPGGTYASGDFLGVNFPYETLTINFTSGNVTAVGGNFFASDIGDVFQASSVTLTLSDLTTFTFDSTSLADSYVGFTSFDTVITSLTLTLTEVPLQGLYGGIDNLTVGFAVPEPASLALVGVAFTGLLTARRRKT